MSRCFIDVGHGFGNAVANRLDPGASGSGTTEAAVVRQVANALIPKLKALGIDASLAPDGNIATVRKPWQRKTLVKGDLFVSLHCNSGTASGTSVYFPADKTHLHDDADQLAADIASKLGTRNEGGRPDTETAVKYVGVLHANPDANQLLVELVRIGNATDVTAALERGSDAVAYGIARLLNLPTSTMTQEQKEAWDKLVAMKVYSSFTKQGTPVTTTELAVFLARLLAALGK